MIIGKYELFCKKYYECEGYEKALNSSEEYFLHHIQGENVSREELIENDLYYDCEPSLLRWVTRQEHMKIHSEGRTHSDETRKKIGEFHKGKVYSAETRKKMSEAMKGNVFSAETRKKISESLKGEKSPNFGKKFSAETRKKMSESKKGMSWKLVDGKRIWYKKEYSS